MTIRLNDLKAQFLRLESDIRAAMDRVLEHGQFIMGPEIFELEAKLADRVRVKHAITCASGTDALLMSLMACGIGPGDAVLTTPFTFIATAEVIALLGATPVFVDIDPQTCNLDPDRLGEKITEVKKAGRLRPRAVIPVDIFGLPSDYDRINSLAGEFDLIVISDAAQSFGATFNKRPVGSLAHITTTSFFPAKPLGCYGDGGAIFTDNDEWAATLASIRIHGKGRDKYDNVRIGLNARLDTLQAAILLVKLPILDEEIAARAEVAGRYAAGLAGIVQAPAVPVDSTCAWASYAVQTDRRDSALAALRQADIATAIYYPKPLHLQGAFHHLGYCEGELPVAETVCRRIFSLPIHPYLGEDETDKVIRTITESLAQS